MNITSPFEHMLCVRSDDHFYKLIFIYSAKLPEDVEELLIGKIAKEIRLAIGWTMGYLQKSWEQNGMLIKHVQIIIPPGGEYLLLQDRLQENFLKNGKTLSVDIGVFIPIPEGKVRENIEMIDDLFQRLGTKDFGNN